MTHQEIKELAGHREVPPWVIKLVGDAVAREREACISIIQQHRDEGRGVLFIIRDLKSRGVAQ